MLWDKWIYPQESQRSSDWYNLYRLLNSHPVLSNTMKRYNFCDGAVPSLIRIPFIFFLCMNTLRTYCSKINFPSMAILFGFFPIFFFSIPQSHLCQTLRPIYPLRYKNTHWNQMVENRILVSYQHYAFFAIIWAQSKSMHIIFYGIFRVYFFSMHECVFLHSIN